MHSLAKRRYHTVLSQKSFPPRVLVVPQTHVIVLARNTEETLSVTTTTTTPIVTTTLVTAANVRLLLYDSLRVTVSERRKTKMVGTRAFMVIQHDVDECATCGQDLDPIISSSMLFSRTNRFLLVAVLANIENRVHRYVASAQTLC